MKRLKQIVALLLCAASISSLAACGKQSTSSEASSGAASQSAVSKGGKTVELWTCWTEGATTAVEGKKMIQKWEQQTGNTVKETNFTYDMMHEKILTVAAGGNTPDLIWGLPEYVGEFYKMGILEDLTSRFNSWSDKSALSSAVVKAMTIDNKVVGIPYEMTVRAYLTHSNDLKTAGVQTPKTWDDLLALNNYKSKTGKYPTELACTGVRAPQELMVYLAQYGLEVASAQKGGKYKNTWNDNKDQLAKATKVFQFYKDMFAKGIVNPSSKSWGWEQTDENFATGLVPTYVSGNWLAEREASNKSTMKDVAISAIPYPADGKPATYMECKPLFVMAGSKNKDEAFNLATAFCSKEWQSAGFADRSPRSDVSTSSKWSKDFAKLADTGVTFPPVTLAGIDQAMIDSIAKVLQNGMAPDKAASWLSTAINASLKDSGELSQ